MSFLPAFVRVRVGSWPALWLPLFLLWPLLLLAFGIVCIAIFALALANRTPGAHAGALPCIASLWRLLCATRGTQLDLEAPSTPQLRISIH